MRKPDSEFEQVQLKFRCQQYYRKYYKYLRSIRGDHRVRISASVVTSVLAGFKGEMVSECGAEASANSLCLPLSFAVNPIQL